MHKLLFCIACCTALNIAAGDASPGALVAALGGMLCCTGVVACDASPGALVAGLGGMLCCTSVATCEACCCISYRGKQRTLLRQWSSVDRGRLRTHLWCA